MHKLLAVVLLLCVGCASRPVIEQPQNPFPNLPVSGERTSCDGVFENRICYGREIHW